MFQTLIIIALAVFATARITRMITVDRVTRAPRQFVVRKAGTKSLISYFVFCPHCVSIWVAAAVSALAWWPGQLDTLMLMPGWLGYPLTWLTVAYLAAIVTARETNEG